MINASGLLPVPVVATHNPLARQPEEEEQARLREQVLPPVEQSEESERASARRRSTQDAETLRAESNAQTSPGSLIDSFA